MTTFKTPLPAKFTFPNEEVKIAINEIIDYLKEREVVENPNGCSAQTATTPGNYTPTLKEQLLGELAPKAFLAKVDFG